MGLVKFRKKVLAAGGWDPQGGASLMTFLMGQCLFCFPNVYRSWRAAEDRWLTQSELARADTVLRPFRLSDDPVVVLLDEESRREFFDLVPDHVNRSIIALRLEGFTHAEIGEVFGLSEAAVGERWRGMLFVFQEPSSSDCESGAVMIESVRRLSSEDREETTPHDIEWLIERSSFGAAAARQLQSRTSPEVRAAIRDRVAELSAAATPTVARDDVHDLVRAAAEGDESAWAQLVDRFNGLVWAIARGYGLSVADASDVAQTTWLRLVTIIDRVRDAEHLGAWLATTARRECLRLLRNAERVQQVPDLPTLDDAGANAELVASAGERDALLQQAMQELSPGCQRLLGELMAAEPASYPEISRRLGIPIGSIGPTRARCLDHLRRQAALLGLDVAEAEIAAPPAWSSDPLPDRLSS